MSAMRSSIAIWCGAMLLPVNFASGAPVQWGGNGHWYQLVAAPDTQSWESARDAAAGMIWQGAAGYLATITSQGEQDFIDSLLSPTRPPGGYDQVFLGASQPQGSDPDADWTWLTGEPWAYTHWEPATVQPSGGEYYLAMFWGPWPGISEPGGWNDEDSPLRYSIVEYAPEPGGLSVLAVAAIGWSRRRWR